MGKITFWEFKVKQNVNKYGYVTLVSRVDQNLESEFLVFRSTGGIRSGRSEPAKDKKIKRCKRQGGIFRHLMPLGLPS